ncbi:efflux RND transporter periplasmic adaptor subunit [Candidatus Marinarcus aquaticus]|uniref:Efflux transporter periplasmic adaptor subunit n=1 Tax=Candidatus Marinarcus aquaticus TaxID=2044504 RepID=A0A4Q0XMC6_9BACT|nr:efflux RND transporter periplasmic adaptor subunit [Candidatus Marinarcus aquaticus]RXJ54434.1 efflux transporter periplasmic adaptor subunit [Candidatus Marinarcus aquaticus]
MITQKKCLLVGSKLLITTTLILGFTACSDEQKKPQNATAQNAGLPVQVFSVKNEKVTTTKSYPALIKPFEEADVNARVQGILKKKHFKEGEFVHKGQLLYTIEQDTYKANLDQAQANYNKANKDYKRAQALLESKAISVQDYDAYVYTYEDAKAKLTQAKIEYGYTTVTSPIDGIAGIKKSDIGDLVGSNDDNSLLITITAIDPVHVEFSLTKDDISSFLSQIRAGKSEIAIENGGHKVTGGMIDYIAPKLDSQTDTLLLRAKFENTNNELIVGNFTKVEISNLSLGDVFVVPENAVLKTAQANIVYVIDANGIAKVRPVLTGDLVTKGIVIKDGIKANEQIVISNLAKLRPDTKVQIVNKAKQL